MPGPRNYPRTKKKSKKKQQQQQKKTTVTVDPAPQSQLPSPPPTAPPPISISQPNPSVLPSPASVPPPPSISPSSEYSNDEPPYVEPQPPHTSITYDKPLPPPAQQQPTFPSLSLPPIVQNEDRSMSVRDLPAFLNSGFADPPALDEPMCRVFAAPDVYTLLCQLLPENTAMMLWHNKTRKVGRICPVCMRCFRLGDRLAPPLQEEFGDATADGPQLQREQIISGICSFVCFGVASLNYPGAIDAWGKIHREMDAVTATIFDGSGLGMPDQGLGTFVKMTRHLDIGIGKHLQMQRLRSANSAKS